MTEHETGGDSSPGCGATDAIDVVVVGGGATGVGVARDLAMRGVEVTLCERSGLAGGTTGRSHGLLHSGARYATTDPESAAHCIGESRVLRDIAGVSVRETGGLFVQLPADDPEHFDERVGACRDLDIPATELAAEEAREDEPSLTADVERAIRVPDAVVYPSRLVAATAESARRHGADIRTHSPVADLLVEDDRVVGVETRDGPLEADHVVNAAGAWAGRVAALAGVDVSMATTKGVMVAVDLGGVDSVLNRCRPPADGDIVVPHDDRLVLGTTSSPVDDPDDVPAEEGDVSTDAAPDRAAVETVLEEGTAMVPAIADAGVQDVYRGVRPLFAGDAGCGRDAPRGFQVFDHGDDDRPGMTTVTGGKLTTYRLMAEAVADVVCERVGVDAPCRTAEEPLPADDPATVDDLVERFDARNPADRDVVGR